MCLNPQMHRQTQAPNRLSSPVARPRLMTRLGVPAGALPHRRLGICAEWRYARGAQERNVRSNSADVYLQRLLGYPPSSCAPRSRSAQLIRPKRQPWQCHMRADPCPSTSSASDAWGGGHFQDVGWGSSAESAGMFFLKDLHRGHTSW